MTQATNNSHITARALSASPIKLSVGPKITLASPNRFFDYLDNLTPTITPTNVKQTARKHPKVT